MQVALRKPSPFISIRVITPNSRSIFTAISDKVNVLDRMMKRFDTAESRISYRLWNDSSVDTLKGLAEKIAIEGGVTLALGGPAVIGALCVMFLLADTIRIYGITGGVLSVFAYWISCNFGRASDYAQTEADN